jgi:hypothetical protein
MEENDKEGSDKAIGKEKRGDMHNTDSLQQTKGFRPRRIISKPGNTSCAGREGKEQERKEKGGWGMKGSLPILILMEVSFDRPRIR